MEAIETNTTEYTKMKTFQSLSAAMKTRIKPEIISMEQFKHGTVVRTQIKARKANGKRVYHITKYENGRYSEAV